MKKNGVFGTGEVCGTIAAKLVALGYEVKLGSRTATNETVQQNWSLMTNPGLSSGDATMLLCGNDAQAKQEVTGILNQFGWNDILDLGEIISARGMEMFISPWVRLFLATNNINVTFKINR